MSNVVQFTKPTKKEEPVSDFEFDFYDTLDDVLDYVDTVADEGIVILLQDGKLLSGSTHTNIPQLIEMLEMTIQEMESQR
jgi:hypothetical protein